MELKIQNGKLFLNEMELKGVHDFSLESIGLNSLDKTQGAILNVTILVDIQREED